MYSYRIQVSPKDTCVRINGTRVTTPCTWETSERTLSLQAEKEGYIPINRVYRQDSLISPTLISLELEKKVYTITIDVDTDDTICSIDRGPNVPLPHRQVLSYGEHTLSFSSSDGGKSEFPFNAYQSGEYLFRLQEKPLFMHQAGMYFCGCAPKQINITPDDRFLFITLLGGSGFQIFDSKEKKIIHTINPGEWAKKCGFVEGLFIEKYHSYFVSQMTTGRIFEYTTKKDHPFYEYPSCEFPSLLKRTIKTGGIWSKVIAYSEPLDLLAVSNWCSHDVSIIEYQSGKVIKKLGGLEVPRGVAFSHSGDSLYIASFEGGLILKYSTETWEEEARIYKKNGAMRHIRVTPDDSTIYVSNMYHFEVYEINVESFAVQHTYTVCHNPNTIELTKDAGFLFVSCRGPNNPEHYTRRSPENGKIMVFDLERKELLTSFRGGNQPTGLDLSHDDSLLVFSNFKDNTIEIYDISALKTMHALREAGCFFPLNLYSFLEKIGEM